MQLIVNDTDTAPGISLSFSINYHLCERGEKKMENLLYTPRNDFMIVAARQNFV